MRRLSRGEDPGETGGPGSGGGGNQPPSRIEHHDIETDPDSTPQYQPAVKSVFKLYKVFCILFRPAGQSAKELWIPFRSPVSEQRAKEWLT